MPNNNKITQKGGTMKISPEQDELNRKSELLLDLENKLSETELGFISLQSELLTFQRRYTEFVVRRMYELDNVELEIAKHLVTTDPTNPEYRQQINKFSEHIAEAEKSFSNEKEISSKNDFKPSDSLKTLYRDIAKKIHPDLVIDEKERARRTEIMAKLNEAYQNGDEQKLEQILNEWQYDPENVHGEDIGSQIVKIIRKIAQVQRRIATIEEETKILVNAEIYNLMKKSEESTNDGVDLLIQMSGYLDVQIHERKTYLDFLRNGGKG